MHLGQLQEQVLALGGMVVNNMKDNGNEFSLTTFVDKQLTKKLNMG